MSSTEAQSQMNGQTPPDEEAGIPDFILQEGRRQAEAGATFYGKPIMEMTREELWGCCVVAWIQTSAMRTQLENMLSEGEHVDEQAADQQTNVQQGGTG